MKNYLWCAPVGCVVGGVPELSDLDKKQKLSPCKMSEELICNDKQRSNNLFSQVLKGTVIQTWFTG